ncbi:MAG: Nucleotidyl transferase [Candidatus Pacebacteria bacterium GW2011_GWB1_47_8]|nr:MAG: Nucleotidyl transferase [Candidatus Pacebacteria bacterium GW2011_GWA1_46_10]KKU84311.1 MAG: Nucleotidyl transferase [Candidatus Pacebacteria bacterium GW2011_GWB1_47_8]HCR81263.1 hypothetical protein [Candidatus Paceibacterota bacterium]
MRTKTRLTITLTQDLLQSIDSLINGVSIKNRSHAIETLIKRSLSPRIHTAVILAGGDLAGKNNSALTKLGSSTLLAYTLSMLKKHHLNRVIICLGKDDQPIMKLFGNGENLGLTIEYSLEEKPLGTGGAVKKIQPLLSSGPFLVMHSDVLTTINLTELFKFHFDEKTLATIAVKPRMGELKYGQVFIQGNHIIRFLEKGVESGISIINTGVYVFEPKVFELFPKKESFTLEKEVFPLLASRGQLSAFFFQGRWFDIRTPASYKTARERWKEIAGSLS